MLARLRHRPTAIFRRGFTLVELMAAVAIVGILAALAVVGYKRYINTAASGEALAVISGIRNAEEAYKAETLVYLGCSANLNAYYPQGSTAPNQYKFAWTNPGHADYACWRTLNVVTDGPVRYGYAVVAGNPGAPLPSPNINPPLVWPASASDNPWYVIQPRAIATATASSPGSSAPR